jgi:hypothetical protein
LQEVEELKELQEVLDLQEAKELKSCRKFCREMYRDLLLASARDTTINRLNFGTEVSCRKQKHFIVPEDG